MAERPTQTPEGKDIIYIRQAGRTPAYGYSRIDPKTGQVIGHIGKHEVERREGNVSYTFLPAEPSVEESIRRTEEKKEARELAEKRLKTGKKEKKTIQYPI